MPAYLITYDLNKETKRPPIVDKIREFNWARLSESCYAISTNMSVEDVYAFFEEYLDNNDTFYVLTLRKPYYGLGHEEVNQWLAEHVPYAYG